MNFLFVQNKCNVGYAFINMVSPLHIPSFYEVVSSLLSLSLSLPLNGDVCRLCFFNARVSMKSAEALVH